MTLELAPAVLVRAAAWPLLKLLALEDSALAAVARELPAESTGSTEYDDLYQRSMNEQSARLTAATTGDPAFLRALVVSNPEVEARLAQGGPPVSRNKKARHRE